MSASTLGLQQIDEIETALLHLRGTRGLVGQLVGATNLIEDVQMLVIADALDRVVERIATAVGEAQS